MKNSTFGFTPSVLILVLGLGTAASRGQAPALDQIDQSERARQAARLAQDAVDPGGETAPDLYEGESSDLGPQSILEITRHHYLEVVADSQIFHTNNFFLTDDDEEDATALVNTLQVSLAPPPFDLGSGEFVPRVGFRQQWYSFGVIGDDGGAGFDFDDFDFYAQTAFAAGDYHFGDGWIAQFGFEAARLSEDDDQRYKEFAPSWGLQKRFEFGSSSQVFLGYEGIYHEATASSSIPTAFRLTDRFDHAFFAVGTTALTERLVAQAYYRFRYTNFQHSDREDHLHSLGLGLHYFITPECSLRTYLAYDNRDTHDSPVPDYEKFNVGAGLNLTISF